MSELTSQLSCCQHSALVGVLGFCSCWPEGDLSPVEYMHHVRHCNQRKNIKTTL